jgi:prophage DNA circulation protein
VTIFEKATQEKFRYPSTKGLLTTEQLWELPLTAKSGFSLDDVAKAVNAELKTIGTESFVATETNPAKATLETKLAVVKHVIAIRLAEDQAAKAAAAKKLEKEKLLAVLGRKQDAVLENLTEAELLARINNL